jgi:signal transduction histidine kinase
MFGLRKKTTPLGVDKSQVILGAIADGVATIDNSGIITSWNKGASIITAWEPGDAINLDYRSIIALENNKGEPYIDDINPIKIALNFKKTQTDNNAYIKTKNKSVAVDITVTPIIAADQTMDGIVVIFRDVSQARGEEKQRADFISTASHEMRTPVAAIEGYLSLALNEKVCHIDSKARDLLGKAHSSTQHLGKLFQDLLTAARSEDGRLTNHPTIVEMGEFLQRTSEDLRFSALKKNLQTEYIIGSLSSNDATNSAQKMVKPLYYIYVDVERLREVVTNIFDNAVKYTDSGKVSLGLTGDSGVVQIYVKDTGPGIPKEDIPHLFQKFYRVDNSATRTIGGTGLGLFICKKIVELYQGHIWVESTPGAGSTFYINLPRLSALQAEEIKKNQANQLKPI